MSFINDINYVLNQDFIWGNSYFEEPGIMKVEIINDGCKSLFFQLDRQLGRKYKGGLYPFFDNGKKKVCKSCDYIVFSEFKGVQYALAIEMKKGNSSTSEQLKAGKCFIDFVVSTANRVCRKNYKVKKRTISIKEVKRKRKTKERGITYDSNSHHLFEQNKFRTLAFLK